VQRAAPRIDTFRSQRQELRQGNQVVIREPGRTIVREGGRAVVRHDDLARLRLRSQGTRVERRGNEMFTFVNRPGGVRIINVNDGSGRLLRRIRRDRFGREIVLIDNRRRAGVVLGVLGAIAIAVPVIAIARERYIVEADVAPPALLYDTLTAPPVEPLERAYSLDEIVATPNLRDRMPRIDLDAINFDTGSWEVTPEEAAKLGPIADAIRRAIEQNPNEVFAIEGYTDAVGDEVDNLSLSDRRAEAVAIVLTEQYGIPPENLTTQGYGEQYLKIPTDAAERRNRRVTVRRITPLLTGEASPQAPADPPPGAQPDQPPQGEPEPQQGEPGAPRGGG
jgi:OOP family OmpA-OmpF porin